LDKLVVRDTAAEAHKPDISWLTLASVRPGPRQVKSERIFEIFSTIFVLPMPRETEAELVAISTYATGAQLERLCRGYRRALAGDESPAPEERTVRRRDLPGGMVRLVYRAPPPRARGRLECGA
jgi:hypothetical protein